MFAGEALKGSEEVVPRKSKSSGNKASFAIMLGGRQEEPVLGQAEPIYVQKPRGLHCAGAPAVVVVRSHPWGDTRALSMRKQARTQRWDWGGEYLGISACAAQDGIPTCYLDPISHLPPLQKEHSALQGSPGCIRPSERVYRLAVGGDEIQQEKTSDHHFPSRSHQMIPALTFGGGLGRSRWPLPVAVTGPTD